MDIEIKEKFLKLWRKYFNGAELPVIFYYTDEEKGGALFLPDKNERCLVSNLNKVRNGESLRFGENSIGCPGGKRYAGFSDTIRPGFEYFLSCGIPGKMEGERYKKSPELVKKIMKNMPKFKAPKKFIVFKRWDLLENSDNPDVVIFFAAPDVLSGLFTLASFDEVSENGVVSPFGAGCSSVVNYPYLEKDSKNPRCVIGMFDLSARPHVNSDIFTFSVPMSKFVRMVDNMEESFLITPTWNKILNRISDASRYLYES